MKNNIVRFIKDGVFTGGWLELNEDNLPVVTNWIQTDGCTLEFTSFDVTIR